MDETDKNNFKTLNALGQIRNAKMSLDTNKSINIAMQSTATSASHSHNPAAPPKRIINKIPLDFNKLKQAGLDRKLAEVLSKQNMGATRNIASAIRSQHISSASVNASASTSNSVVEQQTSYSAHTSTRHSASTLISKNIPTELAVDEKQSLNVKALLKNKILNKSKQSHEQQQTKSTLAATKASKPKANDVSSLVTSGFSLPIAKADLSARSKPPLLLNSVNKLPRHRATCGTIEMQPRRQKIPPPAPVEVSSSPLIVLENKVLAPNEKLDLSGLGLPNATSAAVQPIVQQKKIEKPIDMAKEKQANFQASRTMGTATKKVILNANKLKMSQEKRAQLAKEIHKKAMEVQLNISVAPISQYDSDKTIKDAPVIMSGTTPVTPVLPANKAAKVKSINSRASLGAPIQVVSATLSTKSAPTSPGNSESSSNVLSAVDFIAQLSATNAIDPNNYMELSAEEMSMNAMFTSSQAVMPTFVLPKTKDDILQPLNREPNEKLPSQETIKPLEELRIGMILPIVDMDIMHATLNVNGNKPNVLCISPNSITLESSVSVANVDQPMVEPANDPHTSSSMASESSTHTKASNDKPTLVISAHNLNVENVEEVVKVPLLPILPVCDKEEKQSIKRVPFRPKKGKINLVQRNKKTTNILKPAQLTIEEKSEKIGKQKDISEFTTKEDEKITSENIEGDVSESENIVQNIVEVSNQEINLNMRNVNNEDAKSGEFISEDPGNEFNRNGNYDTFKNTNINETVETEKSAAIELKERARTKEYKLTTELNSQDTTEVKQISNEQNVKKTAQKDDNISTEHFTNKSKEPDKQNISELEKQSSVNAKQQSLKNIIAIAKSVTNTTEESNIDETITLNESNNSDNVIEKSIADITIAEVKADRKQIKKVEVNVANDRDLTQLYHPPKLPKHKKLCITPLNNKEKLTTVSLLDVVTQELPPAQGEPQLPFRSLAQQDKIPNSVELNPTAGLGIHNLLTHLAAENVVPLTKTAKTEEQLKVSRKKLIKTRPVLNAKRSSRGLQAKANATVPGSTEDPNLIKRPLLAELKTNGIHRAATFSTSDDDDAMFHGFNNEPPSSKGVNQLKANETDISDDNTPDYDETEEEPQPDVISLPKKQIAATYVNEDKPQTATRRIKNMNVQAEIEYKEHKEVNIAFNTVVVPEDMSKSLEKLHDPEEHSTTKKTTELQQPKHKRPRLSSGKEKENNKITRQVAKQMESMQVQEDSNAPRDECVVIEEPVVVKESRQSRNSIKNAIVRETKPVDSSVQMTDKQLIELKEELAQSKIGSSPHKSKPATPKVSKSEIDQDLATRTGEERQSDNLQTPDEVLMVSLIAENSLHKETPLTKRKRKRLSRSTTPKALVAHEAAPNEPGPNISTQRLDIINNTPATSAPAKGVTPTPIPKRRGRPAKVPNINTDTPLAKKCKLQNNDEQSANEPQTVEFSGPDYWPPTSGFNLRLLLIRNREQLDSGEELRADGRGKGNQQCGLCLVRCNKANWQMHLGEHYGIGWPIEQPPEFLTRPALISIMTAYLKSVNRKRLSCRLCDRQLASGLGMMLHLEGCGAKVQRVECDACKKSYTHLSFPQHYRSCVQRFRTQNEEEKAVKDAAEEKSSDTVFSNAGRAKRKSTLKAETKLGKLAAQFKNQGEVEKNDFEGDSSDYDMGGEKESSEEYDSEGVDSNEDAPETEPEEGESLRSNRVRKKKVKQSTQSATVGSGKPLYGRYRALEQVLSQRWKYFVDTNYSKSMLYSHLLPRFEMLSSDIIGQLLPSKESTSMRYAYDKVDDKAWMQLAPLQGVNKKSEYICFMGNPVKEVGWVPLPPTVSTQYLLCSMRNKMLGFSRRFKEKQENALLLLLKCTLPPTGDKKVWPLQTCLHYGIRITQGPVHSFAFMPSGGYDETANRLGLLAVGGAAGSVIYGLPLQLNRVTKKQEGEVVIVLQPLLRLSLDIQKPVQNPCTKICWSESAGHSFLVSGYASGHVALWDIADEEGLNFVNIDNERHFLPVNYFYFGERSIRYLELHYDTNGVRWLAVGAMLRKLWIFDIANWSQPLPVLGDTIFNLYLGAVCWPPLWETLAVGSTALYNTQYTRMITLNPSGIIFGHSTVESFLTSPRAVHFNCEQQAMVAIADNGDIAFVYSNQLNLESVISKRASKCRFICTTEACYLGGATEPGSIGPDEFKQDFGLLLKPLINMPNENKSTYLNPKRRPSFDLRTLMRLNCVRWNWNASATNWVAIGAEHGLLRIINFDAGKKFEYL